MRGVRRFNDLRAWQACYAYKKAIYVLCGEGPLSRDGKLRDQLIDSASGPPGHVAEGFGRFSPPDFARFVVIARTSLMESQNHLIDAVDRGYISEQIRLQYNELAEGALEETTGLLEYLQSPEALRNARRVRERRQATRDQRRAEPANSEPANPEPANPEPANPELEPGSSNRTPEPEHEPRSENSEG